MPEILCLPTSVALRTNATMWFGCPVGTQGRPTLVHGIVLHHIGNSVLQSLLMNANNSTPPVVTSDGNATFHYIVDGNGITNYVNPDDMAWAAGLHCNFNTPIPSEAPYAYAGWPTHPTGFSLAETSIHIGVTSTVSYNDLVQLISYLSQQYGFAITADTVALYRDVLLDINLDERPDLDNIREDAESYCERCCGDIGMDIIEPNDVMYIRVVDQYGCEALSTDLNPPTVDLCALGQLSAGNLDTDMMLLAVFDTDGCLKEATWAFVTGNGVTGDGSPDSPLAIDLCNTGIMNSIALDLDSQQVVIFDPNDTCLKAAVWAFATSTQFTGDGSSDAPLTLDLCSLGQPDAGDMNLDTMQLAAFDGFGCLVSADWSFSVSGQFSGDGSPDGILTLDLCSLGQLDAGTINQDTMKVVVIDTDGCLKETSWTLSTGNSITGDGSPDSPLEIDLCNLGQADAGAVNLDTMRLAVFDADGCLKEAAWAFVTSTQLTGDGSPNAPLALDLCALGQTSAGVLNTDTMNVAVFDTADGCLKMSTWAFSSDATLTGDGSPDNPLSVDLCNLGQVDVGTINVDTQAIVVIDTDGCLKQSDWTLHTSTQLLGDGSPDDPLEIDLCALGEVNVGLLNQDTMAIVVIDSDDGCLKRATWTMTTDDSLVGDGSPDSPLGVDVCELDVEDVGFINLDTMSVAVFGADGCLKQADWTLSTEDSIIGDGSPDNPLEVDLCELAPDDAGNLNTDTMKVAVWDVDGCLKEADWTFSTNTTLTGDGSPDDPLSVDICNLRPFDAGLLDTDTMAIAVFDTDGCLKEADWRIITDDTLTGDGSPDNPLSVDLCALDLENTGLVNLDTMSLVILDTDDCVKVADWTFTTSDQFTGDGSPNSPLSLDLCELSPLSAGVYNSDSQSLAVWDVDGCLKTATWTFHTDDTLTGDGSADNPLGVDVCELDLEDAGAFNSANQKIAVVDADGCLKQVQFTPFAIDLCNLGQTAAGGINLDTMELAVFDTDGCLKEATWAFTTSTQLTGDGSPDDPLTIDLCNLGQASAGTFNQDTMELAVFDTDGCLKEAGWAFTTSDQFTGDGSPDGMLSLSLCDLGQLDVGNINLDTMAVVVIDTDGCLKQADWLFMSNATLTGDGSADAPLAVDLCNLGLADGGSINLDTMELAVIDVDGCLKRTAWTLTTNDSLTGDGSPNSPLGIDLCEFNPLAAGNLNTDVHDIAVFDVDGCLKEAAWAFHTDDTLTGDGSPDNPLGVDVCELDLIDAGAFNSNTQKIAVVDTDGCLKQVQFSPFAIDLCNLGQTAAGAINLDTMAVVVIDTDGCLKESSWTFSSSTQLTGDGSPDAPLSIDLCNLGQAAAGTFNQDTMELAVFDTDGCLKESGWAFTTSTQFTGDGSPDGALTLSLCDLGQLDVGNINLDTMAIAVIDTDGCLKQADWQFATNATLTGDGSTDAPLAVDLCNLGLADAGSINLDTMELAVIDTDGCLKRTAWTFTTNDSLVGDGSPNSPLGVDLCELNPLSAGNLNTDAHAIAVFDTDGCLKEATWVFMSNATLTGDGSPDSPLSVDLCNLGLIDAGAFDSTTQKITVIDTDGCLKQVQFTPSGIDLCNLGQVAAGGINLDTMELAVFDTDGCLKEATWVFTTSDQLTGDGSPNAPLSIDLCNLGQAAAGIFNQDTMELAVFDTDGCLKEAGWAFTTSTQFTGDGSIDGALTLNLCALGQLDVGNINLDTMAVVVIDTDGCLKQADWLFMSNATLTGDGSADAPLAVDLCNLGLADGGSINLDTMELAVIDVDGCLKRTAWTLTTNDSLVGDGSPNSPLGIDLCELNPLAAGNLNTDAHGIAVFDTDGCLKTSVWAFSTDDTLTGDGSPDNPLGVDVCELNLIDAGAFDSTTQKITVIDTDGCLKQVQFTPSGIDLCNLGQTAAGGINLDTMELAVFDTDGCLKEATWTFTTDATLTGDGSPNSPLSVDLCNLGQASAGTFNQDTMELAVFDTDGCLKESGWAFTTSTQFTGDGSPDGALTLNLCALGQLDVGNINLDTMAIAVIDTDGCLKQADWLFMSNATLTGDGSADAPLSVDLCNLGLADGGSINLDTMELAVIDVDGCLKRTAWTFTTNDSLTGDGSPNSPLGVDLCELNPLAAGNLNTDAHSIAVFDVDGCLKSATWAFMSNATLTGDGSPDSPLSVDLCNLGLIDAGAFDSTTQKITVIDTDGCLKQVQFTPSGIDLCNLGQVAAGGINLDTMELAVFDTDGCLKEATWAFTTSTQLTGDGSPNAPLSIDLCNLGQAAAGTFNQDTMELAVFDTDGCLKEATWALTTSDQFTGDGSPNGMLSLSLCDLGQLDVGNINLDTMAVVVIDTDGCLKQADWQFVSSTQLTGDGSTDAPLAIDLCSLGLSDAGTINLDTMEITVIDTDGCLKTSAWTLTTNDSIVGDGSPNAPLGVDLCELNPLVAGNLNTDAHGIAVFDVDGCLKSATWAFSTDDTLTGDGSPDNPLGVDVCELDLIDAGAFDSTTQKVAVIDTDGCLKQVQFTPSGIDLCDLGQTAAGGINLDTMELAVFDTDGCLKEATWTFTTSDQLTGDGSPNSPLSIDLCNLGQAAAGTLNQDTMSVVVIDTDGCLKSSTWALTTSDQFTGDGSPNAPLTLDLCELNPTDIGNINLDTMSIAVFDADGCLKRSDWIFNVSAQFSGDGSPNGALTLDLCALGQANAGTLNQDTMNVAVFDADGCLKQSSWALTTDATISGDGSPDSPLSVDLCNLSPASMGVLNQDTIEIVVYDPADGCLKRATWNLFVGDTLTGDGSPDNPLQVDMCNLSPTAAGTINLDMMDIAVFDADGCLKEAAWTFTTSTQFTGDGSPDAALTLNLCALGQIDIGNINLDTMAIAVIDTDGCLKQADWQFATDDSLTGDGSTDAPLSVDLCNLGQAAAGTLNQDDMGIAVFDTDGCLKSATWALTTADSITGDGSPNSPLAVDLCELNPTAIGAVNLDTMSLAVFDTDGCLKSATWAFVTDDTLTGDGSTNAPLSVDLCNLGVPDAGVWTANFHVLVHDSTDGCVKFADLPDITSTVSTDDTISGDGSPGDPLSVDLCNLGLQATGGINLDTQQIAVLDFDGCLKSATWAFVTDATLTGDGSTNAPLSVDVCNLGLADAGMWNATNFHAVVHDASDGCLKFADLPEATVSTDATISGTGTAADPLSVDLCNLGQVTVGLNLDTMNVAIIDSADGCLKEATWAFSTDTTLTGDGSPNSPLSVDTCNLGLSDAGMWNATNFHAVVHDAADGCLKFADLPEATVSTDATISGTGTAADPLSVDLCNLGQVTVGLNLDTMNVTVIDSADGCLKEATWAFSTDDTLTGDGSPNSPLGVDVCELGLADAGAWNGTNFHAVVHDAADGCLKFADLPEATVSTDATISGTGTAASPLSVDLCNLGQVTVGLNLDTMNVTVIDSADGCLKEATWAFSTDDTLTGDGSPNAPLGVDVCELGLADAGAWDGTNFHAVIHDATDGCLKFADLPEATVSTDATISGTGTAASPLSVDLCNLGVPDAGAWNGTNFHVLVHDASDGCVKFADLPEATVSTDATISGTGTAADPLGVDVCNLGLADAGAFDGTNHHVVIHDAMDGCLKFADAPSSTVITDATISGSGTAVDPFSVDLCNLGQDDAGTWNQDTQNLVIIDTDGCLKEAEWSLTLDGIGGLEGDGSPDSPLRVNKCTLVGILQDPGDAELWTGQGTLAGFNFTTGCMQQYQWQIITDSSLLGDGININALRVNLCGLSPTNAGAINLDTMNIAVWDSADNCLKEATWTLVTDSTINGDGSPDNPLTVPLTFSDTNCIDLTRTGNDVVADPIIANKHERFDLADCNGLVCQADGLAAPPCVEASMQCPDLTQFGVGGPINVPHGFFQGVPTTGEVSPPFAFSNDSCYDWIVNVSALATFESTVAPGSGVFAYFEFSVDNGTNWTPYSILYNKGYKSWQGGNIFAPGWFDQTWHRYTETTDTCMYMPQGAAWTCLTRVSFGGIFGSPMNPAVVTDYLGFHRANFVCFPHCPN